jgi:hypothetical protein
VFSIDPVANYLNDLDMWTTWLDLVLYDPGRGSFGETLTFENMQNATNSGIPVKGTPDNQTFCQVLDVVGLT